jgi:DNA-directed RNA polymerase specialized sigma24 family protein
VDALVTAADPSAEIERSFGDLFAELVRVARALGAGAQAEDVAQDALVYGRAHAAQLRDPQRLRPWLRTIAVRAVLRDRRRVGSIDNAPETMFLPADPGLGLDATAAVARLPYRERLAVTLVFGLGFRQEEAADVLGISRGTIAASLWKARRRLARDLADYREGPRR